MKYAVHPIEVEYIDHGTFVGGEEDTSNAGIDRGDSAVVLSEDDYQALQQAIRDMATQLKAGGSADATVANMGLCIIGEGDDDSYGKLAKDDD